MSSRSTRTKAKKKAFVKAHKTSAKQRAAANTVIRTMRAAKMRPGAAGVYRALLNPRVQGFLGLEKKFYDTTLYVEGPPNAPAPIITTAAWGNGVYNPTRCGSMGSLSTANCLSVPSQGPGPQQRIGKSITIKSVQLKGTLEYICRFSATNLPQTFGCSMFLALVLDTQTNGAQCAAADVFTNLNTIAEGLVYPMRNLVNSKRFKILKSETFTFPLTLSHDTANKAVNGGVVQGFDWYLPLEIPVNFIDETDNDIANVTDNSIHVMASSNSPECYITYNARIRFLG